MANEDRVDLLPQSLKDDQDFQKDIKALLSIAPPALRELRQIVGTEDVTSETVRAVVRALSIDAEAASRFAHTLKFLVVRLSHSGTAEELVQELESAVHVDLDKGRRDAAVEILRPLSSELSENNARTAFAIGETFVSAGATPIYAYGNDDQLYSGLSVSISYRNQSERRTVSFNASTLEVRELVAMLNRAIEKSEEGAPGLGLEQDGLDVAS